MSWWCALNATLFMTCRNAAPLISHRLDRPLPAEQRIALRVHLAICPACRRYRGQLVLLDRVIQLLGPHDAPTKTTAIPPEAKSRIRRALEYTQ
jgi:hypothetical protein